MKLPLSLIGIAVVIYIGYGVFVSVAFEENPPELNARLLILVLLLFLSAITSVLSIPVCFLLARRIGIQLGSLASVSVKLIAGTFFPIAVGLLFLTLAEPISMGFAIYVGGVSTVVIYVNLFRLLFRWN